MCGRYSLVTSEEKLKEQFGPLHFSNGLRNNYNVAPTQGAYVITNEAPQKLQYLTWGLIPYWSKSGENSGRLINARAEGISSKPSFRLPVRQRRCLVIADSFYEWRRDGHEKIPHRILLKDGNLAVFAGIWDVWLYQNKAIKSFSIITTPPNGDMEDLHNRMPAFLQSPDEQQQWLSKCSLPEALSLLRPAEDGILTNYRVSQKVNSVQHNTPELHDRVQAPPTLF